MRLPFADTFDGRSLQESIRHFDEPDEQTIRNHLVPFWCRRAFVGMPGCMSQYVPPSQHRARRPASCQRNPTDEKMDKCDISFLLRNACAGSVPTIRNPKFKYHAVLAHAEEQKLDTTSMLPRWTISGCEGCVLSSPWSDGQLVCFGEMQMTVCREGECDHYSYYYDH